MARRPVFITNEKAPYFTVCNVDFIYNSGMAPSQKKKNITAIHEAFHRVVPEMKVLEISSKSMQKNGDLLSAFNMKKYVPSLGKSICVENIYQAGKVFENGGPYTDLLNVSPKEAKTDERLKSSGKIIKFVFDGKDFPAEPVNMFYDYIYMNALLENDDIAKTLFEYDAFTDIEFNPQKSINCQARAAAVFLSLSKLGLIDKVKDPDMFIEMFGETPKEPLRQNMQEFTSEETKKSLSAGDIVIHKIWGEGKIISADCGILTIKFEYVGEKKMGESWVLQNCIY